MLRAQRPILSLRRGCTCHDIYCVLLLFMLANGSQSKVMSFIVTFDLKQCRAVRFFWGLDCVFLCSIGGRRGIACLAQRALVLPLRRSVGSRVAWLARVPCARALCIGKGPGWTRQAIRGVVVAERLQVSALDACACMCAHKRQKQCVAQAMLGGSDTHTHS